VTTGFGGSADTNTTDTDTLQVALLQMQLSAILPVPAEHRKTSSAFEPRSLYTDGEPHCLLSMPEAWVRGTMLIRCNSLLRGHSAVRLSVIKTLLALLENDVVPLVPLRGSISASGDLCPLSYLAGALEGNPDVRVWVGPHNSRTLVTANLALQQLNITPISFGPKETLAILNGTAVSAAVATLALHQADHLALLAQVLTSIGVEALLGRRESFDPFIANVRPHKGQKEVAQNIWAFLEGSLLARAGHEDIVGDGHLRQDRYALRTASQWIGPQLEDLMLARDQLETELNSTTDNPMFDATKREVHHAGNFQAVSVTSSTEKTRLVLQMIGKMIFAQSTELLDCHLSHGLPPNLAADEPSLSYTLKGVDINMASYMSELALLANPVSSHVQSAEMSNQSINSLALVSARYTHMAVDVLSLMMAAYLYSLCQALDLRVMHARFMEQLKPSIEVLTADTFGRLLGSVKLNSLNGIIWTTITLSIDSTTTKDSTDRFTIIAKSAQTVLIDALGDIKDALSSDSKSSPEDYKDELYLITSWTKKAAAISKAIFLTNRVSYLAKPDATPYLGSASKKMYKFVRKELQVPFHKGLVDHPTYHHTKEEQSRLKNTGSQISIIYESLRDERLMVPVMECVKEALEGGKGFVSSKL
jgi:phenylalanine ammonia-lyase